MVWENDNKRPSWHSWETKLFSFNPIALVYPKITDDEWLDGLTNNTQEDRDLYGPHIYTPRLLLMWLDHYPNSFKLTLKRMALNGMYDIYKMRETLRQTTLTKQDILNGQ